MDSTADRGGHKTSSNLELTNKESLVTNITCQMLFSAHELFKILCSYIYSAIDNFLEQKQQLYYYLKILCSYAPSCINNTFYSFL